MYATKKRKPDQLDGYSKRPLTHEETVARDNIREEYRRIEGLVKEWTRDGKGILLGTMRLNKFEYHLPSYAEQLGCDTQDLLAVLRRMKVRRLVGYREDLLPGDPKRNIAPISYRWYLAKERLHAELGFDGGDDPLEGGGAEGW